MSEAYFATDALSSTGIKKMLDDPYSFYIHQKEGPPNPEAPHFRIGHALHQKLLGVGAEIVIYDGPTKTLASKAGEFFLSQNKGKTCLTKDEDEMVQGMVDTLTSYPSILKLLEGAKVEQELYAKIDGVSCKGMLDIVTPNAILDIKTTSASLKNFRWEAKEYRYDIQAAWYQFMHEQVYGKSLPFYFIVVEKSSPYRAIIRKIKDEKLEKARALCLEMLEIYRTCKETNKWPRAPLEISELDWIDYE